MRANLLYTSTNPTGHGFGYNLTNSLNLSKPIHDFNSIALPRFPSVVTSVGVSYSGASPATLFQDGTSVSANSGTPLNYAGTCPSVTAQLGLMTDVNGTFTESMDLAEILIYDWSLGASEINALGCYARNKYGILNYSGTCN